MDARNVRNIVLMRPVRTMIEFKQIIGRGTRLFDGKDYFTIYDFVKAHLNFQDPEWDARRRRKTRAKSADRILAPAKSPPPKQCESVARRRVNARKNHARCAGRSRAFARKRKRAKVKLADGKERTIQHMMMTTFWHPDGTPMSSQQFITLLFGQVPDFFQSEEELRKLWSAPDTRARLLAGLAEKGFGHDQLAGAEVYRCREE